MPTLNLTREEAREVLSLVVNEEEHRRTAIIQYEDEEVEVLSRIAEKIHRVL